jgi:hypothetical protein
MHEPMFQVRGAAVESNQHWPPFNRSLFNWASLPIGNEEDAGNSRRLPAPRPRHRHHLCRIHRFCPCIPSGNLHPLNPGPCPLVILVSLAPFVYSAVA